MDIILESASLSALEICISLIEAGKTLLKMRGIRQWDDTYPDRSTILQDLNSGSGYLLKIGDEYAAYFSLTGEEVAYRKIRGKWNCAGPYAVLHRLAIADSFVGKGVGDVVIEKSLAACRERGVTSLRTDTVQKNIFMRRLLERNGFLYAGIVDSHGLELVAYERYV